MPGVQTKAESVLAGVKARGAAAGEAMDAATEVGARARLSYLASARSAGGSCGVLWVGLIWPRLLREELRARGRSRWALRRVVAVGGL